MTKHLPPNMWYCRHPNRDMFDVGPYPTREDAIEDGPTDMGLAAGQLYEVGRMVPVVPVLHLSQVVEALEIYAIGHPSREPAGNWVATLNQAAEDTGGALLSALNLVVAGWMTSNDLWPGFGTMEEVTTEGRLPFRPHQYHPNLDGPAEPVAAAMAERERRLEGNWHPTPAPVFEVDPDLLTSPPANHEEETLPRSLADGNEREPA